MYIIRIIIINQVSSDNFEIMEGEDKYVFNKRTLVGNIDYARKFSSIDYANNYLLQCRFKNVPNYHYEIVWCK